jgi:hypothetical protein
MAPIFQLPIVTIEYNSTNSYFLIRMVRLNSQFEGGIDT